MFWKDLKRAFGMWIFGFLLLGLSLFIQTKIGDDVGGAEQEVAGAAILGGGLVMVVLVGFLIGLSFLGVASGWVLNTKAGKPGWTSLVPILNAFEFVDMAGRPAWWFFLLLIPGLNIAVVILLCINLAENFGKGTGFGLGLVFLGFIFFPILAFGDSVYQPVPR